MPRPGVQGPTHTHEYYALLRHVDDLCRGTSYPVRASTHEDEPLVQQLLAAGTRDRANTGRPSVSEYDVATELLAAEQAPDRDWTPKLAVVRTRRRTGPCSPPSR
ncbi:hypothetical protein LUR56_15295 [Streptomyces sp. MT29]|nr:hypothetical protein [Streptomyces sp. MT29]